VIVKIYTGLFGLQSYLIKGIRNPKSKIKPGLFQPLTLLDLIVYHKEKQSLQSVREVRLAHAYQEIPFDIRKSSVALFINELLYKAIREEEPNPGLFAFLWNTCLQLDSAEEGISGFHIQVAVQLMQYLGIFPQTNYTEQCSVFNMREGIFQTSIPGHPHYLDQENSMLFHSLLINSDQPNTVRVQNIELNAVRVQNIEPLHRGRMLEIILLYYQLHLPGFKGMQSHHILHSVFS
jgi:DNA repair protein RecO (recombination protein O)